MKRQIYACDACGVSQDDPSHIAIVILSKAGAAICAACIAESVRAIKASPDAKNLPAGWPCIDVAAPVAEAGGA